MHDPRRQKWLDTMTATAAGTLLAALIAYGFAAVVGLIKVDRVDAIALLGVLMTIAALAMILQLAVSDLPADDRAALRALSQAMIGLQLLICGVGVMIVATTLVNPH